MAAPSVATEEREKLTEWVNVIAFSEALKTKLLKCKSGEPIVIMGNVTLKFYTTEQGNTRIDRRSSPTRSRPQAQACCRRRKRGRKPRRRRTPTSRRPTSDEHEARRRATCRWNCTTAGGAKAAGRPNGRKRFHPLAPKTPSSEAATSKHASGETATRCGQRQPNATARRGAETRQKSTSREREGEEVTLTTLVAS